MISYNRLAYRIRTEGSKYALGGVNQVARCDGDELHTIDGARIAQEAGLWLYALHYCFYIRVP